MYTSEVLLAVNNSPAVYRGYCEPNFTMRVKDLNTVGKAITLDSAQFELRFQSIGKNNKIFVVKGKVISDVEDPAGFLHRYRSSHEDYQCSFSEKRSRRRHIRLYKSAVKSGDYSSGR